MAKKYRLLKDLPFAKAGDEFKEMHDDGRIVLAPEEWDQHRHEIDINDIDNFDEWFEEIEEPELPKKFFYVLINKIASVNYLTFSLDEDDKKKYIKHMEECKSVGNYFETKEEAEKYLEYLKAKAIIEQDTKGFKPDWDNKDETKYWGCYDFYHNKLDYDWDYGAKRAEILFKTIKDIEESFKKHPEEWKIYLTYEQ